MLTHYLLWHIIDWMSDRLPGSPVPDYIGSVSFSEIAVAVVLAGWLAGLELYVTTYPVHCTPFIGVIV